MTKRVCKSAEQEGKAAEQEGKARERDHKLDLRPFTMTAAGPVIPIARLVMKKDVLLTFNAAAFALVMQQVGKDVSIAFDPDTGRIALTKGDDRRIYEGYAYNWPRIALNAVRDYLGGIYGRCSCVYFNVERYDNAIELVPNGRTGR